MPKKYILLVTVFFGLTGKQPLSFQCDEVIMPKCAPLLGREAPRRLRTSHPGRLLRESDALCSQVGNRELTGHKNLRVLSTVSLVVLSPQRWVKGSVEDLHTSSPSDWQREAQTNLVQIREVGGAHGPLSNEMQIIDWCPAPSLHFPLQPWPSWGRWPGEEGGLPLRGNLQMGEPSPTVSEESEVEVRSKC